MPRLPRIQIQGAVYFVTSRGLRNQAIFKDRADYKMYMDLLEKYKSQHQFKLYAYSLLTDHLYLLIETGPVGVGASISQIMHDLTSLYTKYFNGRYGQRGHLFESRFKSVLVEKAQYLLEMTRHIHSSPAQNYPYSSYHFYVLNPEPPVEMKDNKLDLSQEVKEVLEFLAKKGDGASYEKYCLAQGEKESQEFAKSLHRTSVLGTESFINQVREELEAREKSKEEQSRLQGRAKTYRYILMVVGVGVLVVSGLSVYLYISRESLENKYASLLEQKETAFLEKSRFENRNPLGLSDLEGTLWQMELVSPAGVIKDTFTFAGGRFSSEYAKAKGFSPSSYFLTPRARGSYSWQAAKSNANGDTITWRADWRGDAMKGVVSFKPAGQAEQAFSLFSVSWSYLPSDASLPGSVT